MMDIQRPVLVRVSTNGVARGIIGVCFAWATVCLCFGGMSAFCDAVGGFWVVALSNSVAILLAGGLSSVLLVSSSSSSSSSKARRSLLLGEPNMDAFSMGLILLPLCIYVGLTARAFFHRVENSDGENGEIEKFLRGRSIRQVKVEAFSNILGVAACYALGLFFIPIARFSPIIVAYGLNPIAAVRVHVWAGTIAYVAAAVHGVLYLVSWKLLEGESWIVMFIPSEDCFRGLLFHDTYSLPDSITATKSTNSTDVSVCKRAHNCTCAARLINFTGVIAFLAMSIIALTSINWIRRNYYALFYKVHVTLSPIFFVMLVMHFRFVMIYIGGGLLYYFVCCIPVWVESYFQKPVQIVAIEEIAPPESSNHFRPLVGITFAVTPSAKTHYRPGQYVKLLVPSISSISHPFTVNLVPDEADTGLLPPSRSNDARQTDSLGHHHSFRMRVLFRATGPFTRALHSKLTATIDNPLQTPIYLHGFVGPSLKAEQARQHDLLFIVAGGVGIAPYLSLLDMLLTDNVSGDGADKIHHPDWNPSIRLHWICREPQLVEYVRKSHFNKLRSSCENGCRVRIILHDTSRSGTVVDTSSVTQCTLESPGPAEAIIPPMDLSASREADNVAQAPFSPSLFATGSKLTCAENVPNGLTFLAIGLVGLVWIVRNMRSSGTTPLHDVGSLLILLLGSIAISILIVLFLRRCNRQQPLSWSVLRSGGDEDAESIFPGDMVPVMTEAGRPDLDDIFAEASLAKRPGLFLCGPEAMVGACKHHAVSKSGPKIAMYEEVFLM